MRSVITPEILERNTFILLKQMSKSLKISPEVAGVRKVWHWTGVSQTLPLHPPKSRPQPCYSAASPYKNFGESFGSNCSLPTQGLLYPLFSFTNSTITLFEASVSPDLNKPKIYFFFFLQLAEVVNTVLASVTETEVCWVFLGTFCLLELVLFFFPAWSVDWSLEGEQPPCTCEATIKIKAAY